MSETIETQATSIILEGELTIYNAENIKAEIFECLEKKKNVNVDLAGITEFDTAGLQALLFGKKYAEQHNISLCFELHSTSVTEVLGLYGLNSKMENEYES